MKQTTWLVLGVTLIAAVTHLLFLTHPREVVFDEVHFGKFVTAYCCTRERFFDIHPPHAKEAIAGVAYLGGYRGGFDFDHIGEPYGTIPIGALRLLPAVMGVLLTVIIFILLRQFGVSQWGAAAGALLVALDNALIVQSRLISLDTILLVAAFGSLSSWLAAQTRRGWTLVGYSLLAGALAGLAVGIKFTGLAALALLAVIILTELAQSWWHGHIWRPHIGAAVLVVATAAIVYSSGWALHWWLLPNPGPGDAWRVPQWNQPLLGSFVRETITMHRLMLEANYNLKATHPDESPWWSWPIMKRPVFYWSGPGGAGIYFLGNPVVWWGMTLIGLLAVASVVLGSAAGRPRLAVPLLGYAIALAPLIRVPRALFLYHYLTPLIFSLLVAFVWLDTLPRPRRRLVYGAIVGLTVASWFMISPFTYGFTVGSTWHGLIDWFVARS